MISRHPRLIVLALFAGFGIPNIGMTQNGQALPSATTIEAGEGSLIRIPEPKLARVEEAVREHLLAARADLVSLRADPKTTESELGDAYGRLGQIYHAHRLDASAETCQTQIGRAHV